MEVTVNQPRFLASAGGGGPGARQDWPDPEQHGQRSLGTGTKYWPMPDRWPPLSRRVGCLFCILGRVCLTCVLQGGFCESVVTAGEG